MIRTYKRKLRLSKKQSITIDSWMGACRLVYNLGLEIKIAGYRATGKSPSAFDLIRQLTGLRSSCGWLADAPCSILQNALLRLEKSYRTFFKGGGFPKWASKKRWKSIEFSRVSVKNGSVKIFKLPPLKFFKDAPIQGQPKTAQIVKEPTGYFICIQCELPDAKLCSDSQAAIGLDLGIARFCVGSDGSFIENPRHFVKYERQLRIENRALVRKQKGSAGWKKQAARLARLHHKIGNVRRDFLHKESTKIAKQYGTVYLEDLHIKNMVRGSTLAASILDCGWGSFRTMLTYKTNTVAVIAKHTSQTCHACGHKDAASRQSQSKFCCTACGHEDNADLNAAKNIMGRGTALKRQRKSTDYA